MLFILLSFIWFMSFNLRYPVYPPDAFHRAFDQLANRPRALRIVAGLKKWRPTA